MANNILTMTFTNNGKTLILNGREHIKKDGLTGFGLADTDIQTMELSQVHGSYLLGVKMQERNMSITFDYIPTFGNRQYLNSFFNPLFDTELVIVMTDENLNVYSRKITCRVQAFNFPVTTITTTKVECTLELLAPYPFFLDVDDFGYNVAATQKRIRWPLSFPKGIGIVHAYRKFDSQLNLKNKGDVPIPLSFRIVATNSVVNPRLENLTNGTIFQIGTVTNPFTMNTGDTIIVRHVNTTIDVSYTAVNTTEEINIINDMSSDSTPIFLEIGDNLISYNADDGYANMKVYLTYSSPFNAL